MIARLIPYLMMFGVGFFVALVLVRRDDRPSEARSYDRLRRALEDVRALLRAGGPRVREDALHAIDAALGER